MENKKRILILEDDVALINGIGDKFGRKGFETIKAKNGEDGLKVALKEHPDFILLDLSMPIMDGNSFLFELRKDTWGKEAKVVAWTNSKNNSENERARGLGVLDIWIKSDYDFTQIVDKVSKILEVK